MKKVLRIFSIVLSFCIVLSMMQPICFAGVSKESVPSADVGKIGFLSMEKNLFDLNLLTSGSTISGKCGENVEYEYDYDEKTLTISGTGEMESYTSENLPPWYSYCNEITTAVISGEVTNIAPYSFYDCKMLNSIDICDTIIRIDEHAFFNCTSLSELNIPSGVEYIGFMSFYGCSGIESIDLPDSIKEIGLASFMFCTSLKTISLPSNLEKIGNEAFAQCYNLEEVILPESLKEIGSDAFYSCQSLKSLFIPQNVNNIGSGIVVSDYVLESLTVSIENTAYKSIDGILYTYDGRKAIACVGTQEVLSFAPGTEIIGYEFAYGCRGVKTIIIPEGVKEIDPYAFSDNNQLNTIYLPNTISSIGFGAFEDCDGLSTVYYNGTEQEWSEISIGVFNDTLFDADRITTVEGELAGKCGDSVNWRIDGETLYLWGSGEMTNYSKECNLY